MILSPGLHLALLEHPEVEARAVVGDEQRGNLRIVHADPDPVAGDAGLRHLEDRAADLVAIADAHLVVAESLDGEVLAELSVHEVVPSELAFPVPIRVDLVDEHRALLAAVARQIALTIAVNVEPADPAGTGHGILEDPGEDRPPLPGHVLRQADVDRQQRPDAAGPPTGARARLASRRGGCGSRRPDRRGGWPCRQSGRRSIRRTRRVRGTFGRWLLSEFALGDGPRRVDQPDVAEGLGEVAEELSAYGVDSPRRAGRRR